MRTVPEWSRWLRRSWFGGLYKDEKPENFFAQFGTDPDEIFKVMTDFKIPDDQLAGLAARSSWLRSGLVSWRRNMAGESEIAS